MVAPYVNPLINFLPINAALDNINDTAVAREKVRATVEAGRRDDSRLELERQRLAQAAKMNELEYRIKEDAQKYLPTQRQLQEEAIRSEIAKRRKETEFIGHKPVDPIVEQFLRELNPGGTPPAPGTPSGPAAPIEGRGTSPGGPADGPMPSVPGVVVAPPTTPTITQLVPPRPVAPAPVQPTQAAPPARPQAQPVQAPAGQDADPILNTPFGPRRASQLQRMEMLLRLGGKQDAAEQIKNLREGGRKLRSEDMKAINEADQDVLAAREIKSSINRALWLNDPKRAYDGPAATQRAWLVNNTPIGSIPGVDDKRGVLTDEFSNLTTDLALKQLKTTFGGNPTEGERKILLDVQGAANQPREVRERILRRAQWFADRRLDYNRRLAAAVRDGSYYRPGGQIELPPDPTDEELEKILAPKKPDRQGQAPGEAPQRAPGAPIGRPTQSRPQQDPTIQPLPKEQRSDWPTPNDGHIQALLRNPTPEAKEFFKQKFGPNAVDDILKGRR